MISRAVHVTVLIIITGHKFYNRHLNHKKLFLKKKTDFIYYYVCTYKLFLYYTHKNMYRINCKNFIFIQHLKRKL